MSRDLIKLKAFTSILLACLCIFAYGQNEKVTFHEIIKGDSVILFFNERYHFCEKPCADYIRFVRINKDGNFMGQFIDIGQNNSLLGNGAYLGGKRNGHFELHNPNGKLSFSGSYEMGKPIGSWDFYYENGLPNRTIKFTDTDTLLIRFVDEKGNVKVSEGSGEFEGYVTGRSNSNKILAKGKIKNGKPDGKWTSKYGGEIYCKEVFENGKLIKGSFPNAKIKEEKNYKTKSFLNTFLLVHYAESLENFQVEKCADSLLYPSDKYSFNTQIFTWELRNEIGATIGRDVGSYNTLGYWKGPQYLVFEFIPDKNGKPENTKLLSNWGQPFVSAIGNALRSIVRYPPGKKMYLHLRLDLAGMRSYSFAFKYKLSPKSVISATDTMY